MVASTTAASRTHASIRPNYKPVLVESLDFDPDNPRFGGTAKGFSQDKIQELLEQNPHYAKELVPSFVQNGFIAYEPLVVREKGDRYVVIEGNRRLAAIRYICSSTTEFPEEVRRRFTKIPVLIFPPAKTQGPQQDAVRVYLGIHHLFGFREWPPESKAKFLDRHIHSAEDLQRFEKEMGFGRSEFERYLIPYRLRKHAGTKVGAVPLKDFWTFGEALNRADIKEYLRLDIDPKTLEIEGYDPGKLKYLLGFLYGIGTVKRRIGETRQIGTLAKILGSKKASEVLEKGVASTKHSFTSNRNGRRRPT